MHKSNQKTQVTIKKKENILKILIHCKKKIRNRQKLYKAKIKLNKINTTKLVILTNENRTITKKIGKLNILFILFYCSFVLKMKAISIIVIWFALKKHINLLFEYKSFVPI
jgi:hypothetical protein